MNEDTNVCAVAVVTPHPTYEQLKQAAAELIVAGKLPSCELVQQQLGGHVNAAVIDQLLERWHQDLRSTPFLALPQAVPEPVTNALTAVWHTALEQASTGLRTLREAADIEIANATAHRVDALANAKHERARALSLEDTLAERAARITELDVSVTVLRERLAASQAHADAQAQDAKQAIDKANEAHATLAAQLALRDATHLAAERLHASQFSEQATLVRQAERIQTQTNHQLQSLTQNHRHVHDQLADKARRAKLLEQELKSQARDNDDLTIKLDQQHAHIRRLSARHEAQQERIAISQGELRNVSEDCEILRKQLHHATIESAQAQRDAQLLREQMQQIFDSDLPLESDQSVTNHH